MEFLVQNKGVKKTYLYDNITQPIEAKNLKPKFSKPLLC